MTELFPLIERLASRTAEAALGRARIVNTPLRTRLRAMLSGGAGSEDGLLASPVLEAAFGYQTAPTTMEALADAGLLTERTVTALAETTPLDPADRAERNTMPLDRAPYTHQLEAWQALAGTPPRSVLVSSGTGSGKTEAFLVPILDALAREAEARGRLRGVRALLLYPLNALIASQRDRLADWTAPFGGDLRFCLYNGLTREQEKAEHSARMPYEVRDRATLRADPPPLLVTNATMLEYMLARPADAPILAASRGRLRYIVLDEAHSYIGSQAAEMTLLLRRTLLAFGVRADQVSFIATSATLGDGAEVQERLRRFLTDLSGAAPERVVVITGARDIPPIDPGAGGLAVNPDARAVRDRLTGGPESLASLEGAIAPERLHQVLEQAVQPPPEGSAPFLPLRLHLFHRAQGGIFACADPACPDRAGTALDSPDWPFGRLYTRDRETCAAPGCGARVFPLLLCDDCGQPLLEAALSEDARQLTRWREDMPIDAFDPEAAEAETDDDDTPPAQHPSARRLLLPDGARHTAEAQRERLAMERATGMLRDRAGAETLALTAFEDHFCPACGAGNRQHRLFRHLRVGGAFSTLTAGTVLLEAAPARTGRRLPSDGRQLITFTDSRQGTARFAASWQHDAERNFARARILHRLHEHGGGGISALDDEITGLQAALKSQPNGALQSLLNSKLAERANAGAPRPVGWDEMKKKLAELIQDQPELRLYWREREGAFDSAERLAELHLYTEFLRRPLRANSLETLGLAALRFPAIEKLADSALPPLFQERGASLADWKDYLHLLITYYLRANSAVGIDTLLQHWTGQKVRTLTYLHQRVRRELEPRERRWPFLTAKAGRVSRLVLLLRDGLGLDLSQPATREAVNEALDAAWRQLQPIGVSGLADGGLRLDLAKAELVALDRAFLCPVTDRLLDRGFRGITPYLGQRPQPRDRLVTQPLAMPRLPHPWCRTPDGSDASAATSAWLHSDPAIAELRRRGLWTDIGDRLALLAPFARIVEHSAQQPPDRLRGFERAFRAGRINVLNCSTTMEMGVDIGGISTVAMANVPPSPANYRQRIGRAGRRREPLSIGFTYCPDTPLGWYAFDAPSRLLTAPIDPPRVALDSRVLAQRHANALLLARFLAASGIDMTKFEAGAFFAPGLGEQSPARRFHAWLLRDAPGDAALADDLAILLAGTALAGSADPTQATATALDRLATVWCEERQRFDADLAGTTGGARNFLRFQVERMEHEYLLGELVRAAFLPGHGFPTDVVPFVTPPSRHQTEREEAPAARRSPARTLDLALSEYAPGGELVIDGVVYRSGGVSLNWKRPADAAAAQEVQAIRFLWNCRRCGATGDSRQQPAQCPGCGNDALQSVRALRPAGFIADPDMPAGNAVEYAEPVPAMQPFLAAATPWTSLANPAIGRFRHDPEGLVITVSRGAAQHGYALCLRCGRAEPEPAGAEARLPPPDAIVSHRSLRQSPGGRLLTCDAGPGSFALQRHLALGHSRQTDLFALHLPGLPSRGRALSLAIALREALCRRLGIARDEVAWHAEPASGGQGWTVFLFDVAAGGAGYAGSAAQDLPGLLRATLAALDCANPGCVRGCPACLVLRDTVRLANHLDRSATHSWLADILPQIVLPVPARVFGEAVPQHMEQAPLAAALRHALSAPGAALTLLLHGAPAEWDEADWWGLPLLDHAAREGREVTLLAEPASLRGAGYDAVLTLRGWAARAGGRLRIAALAAPSSPPGLFAVVTTPAGTTGWAAPQPTTQAPEAVIRTDHAIKPRAGAVFDPVARARALQPDAWHRRIGPELDGPIAGFGARFWQVLADGGAEAALRVGAPRHVIYSDRYLFSPLALRLLHEVLLVLRRRMAAGQAAIPLTLRTLGARTGEPRGLPRHIDHDWQDLAMRDAVAGRMLTRAGFAPALESDDRATIAHARVLTIEGAEGSVRLQLDQGFGHWRRTTAQQFDFTAGAVAQAKALFDVSFRITGASPDGTEVFVMRG
jgi:ATP-dependent helicase YprA (DUF1998 family)